MLFPSENTDVIYNYNDEVHYQYVNVIFYWKGDCRQLKASEEKVTLTKLRLKDKVSFRQLVKKLKIKEIRKTK